MTLAPWLLAPAFALLALAPASLATGQDPAPADVCLELTSGAASDADWAALEAAISDVVADRPALFPNPTIDASTSPRLDIHAGHARSAGSSWSSCLEAGFEWTARFGRDFLQAGAEQSLAEAPTTPGIDSSVTIEWYPAELRVRTRLDFAGPFDIPNGTCWVDDVLSVEADLVVASGEQGRETSPFAESACGRFFDHLPDGGAGEQAVTLLPATVETPDGSMLSFVAQEVLVEDEGISVSGTLRRD